MQLAKNSCSEPTLLLQLILAEKILDQAERSIRYTKIDTYSELFKALRTQVFIPVTVNDCKQGLTESVQAFSNRFRRHSELQCAVQSRYKGATSRHIAIQKANEKALHMYITNLCGEIGQTVLACDPKTSNQRGIMKENRPKLTTPRSNFTSTPHQRNVCFQNLTPRLIEAPQPRLSLLAPVPRPPTCEHCKKSDHHQSQCYQLRNFQHRQFGKIPLRVNNLTEPTRQDQSNLPTESTITPENFNTCDYEESMETPQDSYWTQDQE
ncbi:hypothetical protein QLX08_005526 [Tetragonisca angustula]|uniref:Gag protein n=1 Tax=Tetragonisca angustula TaxID=166442 RepID=A0AAW0ZXF2_9HYME